MGSRTERSALLRQALSQLLRMMRWSSMPDTLKRCGCCLLTHASRCSRSSFSARMLQKKSSVGELKIRLRLEPRKTTSTVRIWPAV